MLCIITISTLQLLFQCYKDLFFFFFNCYKLINLTLKGSKLLVLLTNLI